MKKYSISTFEKAESALAERRQSVEQELQRRRREVYALAPEVAVLEQSLAATGNKLLMAAAKGGDDLPRLIEEIKVKNLDTQKAIADILTELKGDPDYLDAPYHCQLCNDTGYVSGSRCRCFVDLLDKFSYEELNASCRIRLRDFSEFREEYYADEKVRLHMLKIREYCRRYADNFSEDSDSLFFVGMTGLGKTFLSACIAKSLIEKGRGVVFGSLPDFLRTVENEHFGRAQGNTLDTMIDCELLILDDLGSEFQTSFSESAIYDIINGRLNLCKPTIISTNLSSKELDARYNERIISRITGCFVPLMFMGKDIRHLRRQLSAQ